MRRRSLSVTCCGVILLLSIFHSTRTILHVKTLIPHDTTIYNKLSSRSALNLPTIEAKNTQPKSDNFNATKELDFFPRIVVLNDEDFRESSSLPSKHFILGNDNAVRRKQQYFDIVPSPRMNITEVISKPLLDFEKEWFTKCEPVVDLPPKPTCNSLHELNAMSTDFIQNVLSMDGNWRSVLKVNNETILKVLHLHRLFDEESFQKHELDNGVMETLTASPYIVSSFGFCGESVVTEFAHTSGRLLTKDKTLKNMERLRLARDLSRGLAELHALTQIDFDENTVFPQRDLYFAHHDINIANTVSVTPKLMSWNDFNLGIIAKQHSSGKQEDCQVPIRYRGDLWRSQEEIRNATPGTLRHMQPCDIFSFGNVLFQIMTKHQPWTHLEDPPSPKIPNATSIGLKKLQGRGPNIPDKYLPTSLALKVVYKAIQACFRLDPLQRPTALQLAQGFQTAYAWTKNETVASRIKKTDIDELFAAR